MVTENEAVDIAKKYTPMKIYAVVLINPFRERIRSVTNEKKIPSTKNGELP
jgi:hypothetical protein